MKYNKIIIFGGAGFVGSNLALFLKKDFPKLHILCVDNLKRRGSELNVTRLKKNSVEFVHGDIRNKEDFFHLKGFDLVVDCSAEPSVQAGYTGSTPEYVINTNLFGTINLLEFARINKSDFLFLSTSRVYSTDIINKVKLKESNTRFEISTENTIPGVSQKGFSEDLPLFGSRSFYGATKLSAEFLIQEYIHAFGMKAIINRCSVIAGPWQMGKVDQGVASLWVARHYFGGKLKYIGYGGKGKQVRDLLHIHDLYRLIKLQLEDISRFSGKIFNVGGGLDSSVSLLELTSLCEKYTGNKINITSDLKNRTQDVPVYLTDNSRITAFCGWKPKIKPEQIVKEITEWIKINETELKVILT